MNRIVKYSNAKITTLGPVIVGGRGFYKTVDVSTSLEGKKLVITMSALKGLLKDSLNFYTNDNFVKKITGSTLDDRVEESFKTSKVLFQDFTTDFEKLDFRTRIRIERMSRTVEPGALFTSAVVPAGTVFEGKIFFKEGLSDDDINKVIKVLNFYTHKIGAAKTAGFGAIKFEVEEPQEVEIKELPPGFYNIFLKPLTPFVSTKYGNQTLEKRYLIESDYYLSGSAIKSSIDVERATFFYPNDNLKYPIVNPKYKYWYKYEENIQNDSLNIILDLIKARINKEAFLLENRGKRLERVKNIKSEAIYNFHIKRSFSTNTVETFWVQQAYKPKYVVGRVYSTKTIRIPEYLTLGGARGKGYGLMKLDRFELINDNPEKIKDRIKNFNKDLNEHLGLQNHQEEYVPIVFTTPTVIDDLRKMFKSLEPFLEFCDMQNFRYYDQNSVVTHIVKAISPGSFVLFKIKDSSKYADELIQKKKEGVGSLVEKGCGDFEIITNWR